MITWAAIRPPQQTRQHDTPPAETGILTKPTRKQIAVINGTDLTGHRQDAPRDTVNGALVLDRVVQMLDTYARFTKPEDIAVLTLMIAGTHFADKDGTLVFDSWPRALILAPKESGKTRMLRLVHGMARNSSGPLDGAEVTAPALRNMLNQKMTVELDEAHLALGSGARNLPLKSLLLHYLNEGGAATGVSGISTYNTFGPVFMGAQPSIMTETRDRLLDLFSRCFTIIPKSTEENIAELDNMYRAKAEFMQYALGRWAAEQRPPLGELLEVVYEVPPRLRSRKRELAVPLLAVADHAADLRCPPGTADRDRWSIIARNAVLEVLLGEGDPDAVMARGDELFAGMQPGVLDAELFRDVNG